MIISKDTQDAIQALKDLKSWFEIKEVPEFKWYLGINIHITSTGIELSQED
jgi:hypothetical protein